MSHPVLWLLVVALVLAAIGVFVVRRSGRKASRQQEKPSLESANKATRSTTAVTYPIVMALKVAEKILGPDRPWVPQNKVQARFLKEIFEPCRDESVPEIEGLASWDAKEINNFLARRKFGIRVPEPFPPLHFGTATVLDLLVKWINEGSVGTVKTDPPEGRLFPGVCLWKGVSILRSKNHEKPIARLETKSGDRVFITEFRHPREGLDLVGQAEELTARTSTVRDYEGVLFPMVDLDQRVDISWMEGLSTTADTDESAIIASALQQTRFRMNKQGARAESAVALTLEIRGSLESQKIKPPLLINEPFLIWFTRPGLSKPLFVGHIAEEDWRNPGHVR
jgi:hypothetical protein